MLMTSPSISHKFVGQPVMFCIVSLFCTGVNSPLNQLRRKNRVFWFTVTECPSADLTIPEIIKALAFAY